VIEKEVKKLQLMGLANPFKIDPSGIGSRICSLVGPPLFIPLSYSTFYVSYPDAPLIYKIIGMSFGVWFLSDTYFTSCDPLPPAKSRVRRLAEAFIGAIKKSFIPAPQPVPIPVKY